MFDACDLSLLLFVGSLSVVMCWLLLDVCCLMVVYGLCCGLVFVSCCVLFVVRVLFRVCCSLCVIGSWSLLFVCGSLVVFVGCRFFWLAFGVW